MEIGKYVRRGLSVHLIRRGGGRLAGEPDCVRGGWGAREGAWWVVRSEFVKFGVPAGTRRDLTYRRVIFGHWPSTVERRLSELRTGSLSPSHLHSAISESQCEVKSQTVEKLGAAEFCTTTLAMRLHDARLKWLSWNMFCALQSRARSE